MKKFDQNRILNKYSRKNLANIEELTVLITDLLMLG